MIERNEQTQEATWSRAKKDNAPRGVFRHPSGVWAIRFTCGAGHIHKEKVGPIKTEATNAYHDRRARARRQAGWCPAVERQHERARAARERARMTLRQYADDYIAWARGQKRSWRKDLSRLSRILPALGDRRLDELTTADIERFLGSLREGDRAVSPATVNRSRDLLSGMFKRAVRLGLAPANPVRGIPKLRESAGRVVYLQAVEAAAVRDALPAEFRPLFAVSVNTGLRWSEQIGLRWQDVDMLTAVITVATSKNGHARRVPMNSVVRSALLDVGAQRTRPSDPTEPVFAAAYRTVARTFVRAVERAQEALRDAGKDTSRLEGYTWHGNRHTFASRLVMAGVDLLTVKELGGWRTLAMVQRYAHLAPGHLVAAVERIVPDARPPLAAPTPSGQAASV